MVKSSDTSLWMAAFELLHIFGIGDNLVHNHNNLSAQLASSSLVGQSCEPSVPVYVRHIFPTVNFLHHHLELIFLETL